jgi:hypothetical protein
MFTRCSILVSKGLAALIFLLGTLHAERPSEHNRETETSLETMELSATNTSEPSALDSLLSDPERVVTAVDPAFPGEPDGISHPAVDIPANAEESAEVAIAAAGELSPVEKATTPPEGETAPREATVSTELMPIEMGPRLRIEDLETVASRLAAIEGNLAGQQQQALDLVLSSNRTALIIGGLFAGVGVLGILMAALVLARILNQLSRVVMKLPAGQAAVAPAMTWPGYEPRSQSTATAIEQVSARFLGAIEQLEQRIHELERLPQPRLNQGEAGNGARQNAPHFVGSTIAADSSVGPGQNTDTVDTTILEPPQSSASLSNLANERHQQVEALLVEGENLLQSDRLENALERFDNALAIEPHNADALIKRGMALERLQRMEAALESYDRAIASNGALTLAYLHKGAVCNRLQRYREALECYERALQTEHKS